MTKKERDQIRNYWTAPTMMARVVETAPGFYEYAQKCINDLCDELDELSALRAAQPLTREGIDAHIAELKAAWRKSGRAESTIQSWTLCCYHLRDALLDSLADKGE